LASKEMAARRTRRSSSPMYATSASIESTESISMAVMSLCVRPTGNIGDYFLDAAGLHNFVESAS
jgi:hypothetical protein